MIAAKLAVCISATVILALAGVGCGGSDSAPATPSTPVPPSTPAAPPTSTRAMSYVTGSVTYAEDVTLSADVVLEVLLMDVSLMDVAATTIAEYVAVNPGQVPIEFEIAYDRADIDERLDYAIQASITEGGRLLFTNDTVYSVITRENPDHVEMMLVQVN